MGSQEQIIVMGGSFNPPTLAHLRIIQAAMDTVGAARGYLVPVSFAYLKRKMMRSDTGRVCLTDEARLRMLKALCREDERLAVSQLELHEIQSVTTHTMEQISWLHPGARYWFVVGSDKQGLIGQLCSADFLDRFGLIVFCRDRGDALSQSCPDGVLRLPQPEGVSGISSTEVRRRILTGESAEDLVTPGVYAQLCDLRAEDFPCEIYLFRDEYEIFSNSYPTEVLWEGITYGSVEAAFQASKTEDLHIRRQFADCAPEKARQKGARLQPEPGWDARKLSIMEKIIRAKFDQHRSLQTRLLETGNLQLWNGNYGKDLFWGIDLYCWQGENHLGRLLMKLREEYRDEELVRG